MCSPGREGKLKNVQVILSGLNGELRLNPWVEPPSRFSRPSPPFFPSPRLPPVRPPKLTTSRENSSRQKSSALLEKVTLGSKKWCQPKCNSFCILNSLRTHSLDKSYFKKSSSEPQTFGHGKWTVWCRTDYNDYDNDYNYGGPAMTTKTRTPRFFGRLPGICFTPAWPSWWDVQFIPILKTSKPKPFDLNHKTFKH